MKVKVHAFAVSWTDLDKPTENQIKLFGMYVWNIEQQ